MSRFIFTAILMTVITASCGRQMADELVVTACGGTEATAELRAIRNNGSVRVLGSGSAYIGRNGLGKEREGDGKTPEGVFHATVAFGIMPDPGTSLPYIPVSPTVFACDEEGPYYNKIIDTDTTSHICHGEKMSEISPEYDYGIATDYNPDNIYPLGSAIFIHCKGEKKSTAGCVAVDRRFMVKILKRITADTRIIISSSPDHK